MSDILGIGVQCNSPLQIIGLLIIAVLLVVIAIVIYKAVRFVTTCLLSFRKVDVNIDKDDFRMETHLRQN